MKVTIEMPANALIPTIEVFKDYFDAKYPCTEEDNDGSDMPNEDMIKYEIFDHLIEIYNKRMDLYTTEYQNLKNQIPDASATPPPPRP